MYINGIRRANMDTEYKRAANITIIAAGVAVFLWLFIKYALGAFLPFLLGAAVAALVSPISKKLASLCKLPPKAVSAILVILLFLISVSLLYFAGYRLISEIGDILERISSDPYSVSRFIENLISRIKGLGIGDGSANSSFWQRIGVDIDALLNNALDSMISSLTSALPRIAAGIVSGIPSFLLFTITFLLSAFYFSIDRASLGRSASSILPYKWQKSLPIIRQRVKKTVTGYLKAYFFIMLLTFTEVFIGLSILKVRYALLLAIIISIVDILPVLGTGTVLIPWAAYSYIVRDVGLGTGLLILYGIILIVRQIAEPKIVGNSIGLHPLATLASVYLGIKFAGFLGIFIGPIVALCIKSFSSPQNAEAL